MMFKLIGTLMIGVTCFVSGGSLVYTKMYLPEIQLGLRGYCPYKDILGTVYHQPCVSDADVTNQILSSMEQPFVSTKRKGK